MTELDNEIPSLASELLAEFGKDIAYIQRDPGAYNTATRQALPVPTDRIIKGMVEPYTGQRMLAGLVEASDLKVTCAASDFEGLEDPTPGDVMGIDGDNYNVITVLPTYSGEIKALYEFQVRRG